MESRSVGILATRLPLARQSARRVEVIATVASIVVALTLWAVLLQGVDVNKFDDLGLVSGLPLAMVAPFGLLLASFVFCIRRIPQSTAVLLIHTVALIVMLYGIRGMIDQVPAFKVTWRHIGIAEVIDRTGQIDPTIDAYFNWPGFFTVSSFLARAAGFSSIEPFANWVPVFFNLLYLAPLLVIMRTATEDGRVIWVAIWTFYLTDWIAQDYLSPQGMVFFLHLVVIAVALRWFTRRDNPDLPGEFPIRSKALLLVVALAIMAFTIPSHQITPFATVFALAALLLSRRLVARSLPSIVAVMTGAWLVLMATDYISGHQKKVTGGIGKLQDTIGSNVTARLTGSTERLFVVDLRLLTTGVVWIVALLGAWRLRRNGRLDRAFVAVALSAFPLMGLQSYGGEVLLRVYLFTLPFAAFFIASALFPTPEKGRSVAAPLVLSAVSVVALAAFAITRYGNERIDTFTPNEVAAVRHVYAIAHPAQPSNGQSRTGAPLLVAGSDNLPWKSARYEEFVHRTIVSLPEWATMQSKRPDPATVVKATRDLMRHYQTGSYLIFMKSENAEIDVIGTSPKGSLGTIEDLVARSPYFRPLMHNSDAQVYVLTPLGREGRS